MNQPEAPSRPRRVVYDVVTNQEQPVSHKQNNHRRRNKKKTGQHKVQQQRLIAPGQQVPIELTPLIQAALEYGRKTHALGALKAAQALSTIVSKLKAMNIEVTHPNVVDLINDAEIESKKILSVFTGAYDD